MNDLISKSALIDALKIHFDSCFREDGELLYSDHICTSDDVVDLINLVENQPNAYNVDKVVEELYEERTEILLSNDYECKIINYCIDNFDKAIEIVKQGGVSNWVGKENKGNTECQKEWMIHIWGGAWNSDADPSIEKDYGIHEGYHYFKTEEEKDSFLEIVNKPEYRNQGLMRDIKYGFMTHKRTIFVGTFKYEDKEFVLHYDLGYEYEEDTAIFYFTKGNFSCDCNRSLAIRWEYGDDAIPELGCGEDIKLVDYHIEYLD